MKKKLLLALIALVSLTSYSQCLEGTYTFKLQIHKVQVAGKADPEESVIEDILCKLEQDFDRLFDQRCIRFEWDETFNPVSHPDFTQIQQSDLLLGDLVPNAINVFFLGSYEGRASATEGWCNDVPYLFMGTGHRNNDENELVASDYPLLTHEILHVLGLQHINNTGSSSCETNACYQTSIGDNIVCDGPACDYTNWKTLTPCQVDEVFEIINANAEIAAALVSGPTGDRLCPDIIVPCDTPNSSNIDFTTSYFGMGSNYVTRMDYIGSESITEWEILVKDVQSWWRSTTNPSWVVWADTDGRATVEVRVRNANVDEDCDEWSSLRIEEINVN